MKTTFICVISIMISLVAFTQTPQLNQSFPDSNAIWINGTYAQTGPFSSGLVATVNYCLTSEDTLINEQAYKKLNLCEADYQGALRSDSLKVYFVPRDSLNEHLIYDFSAEVGDTLYDVYFQEAPDEPGFLADILFVEMDWANSDDYDMISYRFTEQNGYYGAWIDHVGEYCGLLHPPNIYWEASFENQHRLTCHSHLDSTRYRKSGELGPGSCALDLSLNEKSTMFEFELYPNPTSDKLNCVLPKPLEIEEILILNSQGKTVKTIRDITQAEMVIDLSDLPPGLYFLKARTEDHFVIERIVKM